jgi:hypothetical protein
LPVSSRSSRTARHAGRAHTVGCKSFPDFAGTGGEIPVNSYNRPYHTTLREEEAAFEHGFSLVRERIRHSIDGPTQIDETGQKCSGYKGQTPPRDGLSRGGSGDRGRSRWEGAPGDTMTIIGASRDALRVIRAEPGAQPEELKPALDEVEILSEKLDGVWHDG